MKKCPSCQKTYDDTLKFCQVDGTPLVVVAEDTPEENPYKTTVGSKADLPIPPEEKKPEPEPEPEMDPYATMVAGSKIPPPKEEDVLEVPETPLDPMATMVVSGQTAGKIEIDIPEEAAEPAEEPMPDPVAETPVVEPSAQVEEKPAAPQTPAFTPPPVDEKPLAPQTPAFTPPPVEEKPSAPIPSPFDESMPPGFAPPTTPPFETPESPVESEQDLEEQVVASAAKEVESLPSDFTDVEEVSIDIGDVEPAVPAMSAGGQIESSGSDSLSTAEGAGPNQTLAWISLALGILGLPCCAFYIFGLGAIVVGFIARGRANSEPENYGGGTYATIGIVLGFVSLLLGTALLIFQLLLGGLANFM